MLKALFKPNGRSVLMAGANNGTRRLRPNLLITGTPGTGKSTTASALAEATNFRYICVGDLVKEKNLHDGWDDQFQCHVINEDLVCDELEDIMKGGGVIVDYHGCDFFPERWFDRVVVLRTENSVLYDRLTKRDYSGKSVEMGSRMGGRVVHFAHLPIKLLMPTKLTNINEFALKTVPSATKIEIKRVLESLYGFEIEKVNTLNMDGKKKKRGGLLIAKADYKKAYVTLKHPLSISRDLFPVKFVEEDRKSKVKGSSFVEEEDDKKSHWLDQKEKREIGGYGGGKSRRGGERVNSPARGAAAAGAEAKFPWSNMRFGGK